MKVLMLGWELPPHNSGGLGIACYQLCKTLSKNDLDIEFILPYEADHAINFMQVAAAHPQGITTVQRAGNAYDSQKYILGGQETWLNIHDQQRLYEQAVIRLVEDKEFDIVHAHDWLTFRAAVRVKERTGRPIILHVHSVESDRAGGSNRGNLMAREIEEVALQLADRVIAVSTHTKNAIMRDYGVPAAKIEVVHNSIEAGDMTPLDDDNAYQYLSLMKNLGYRVVVNVGRLTIQKGLPNLLRAAKEVIDRAPKTLFLVVGSGEQYHELIRLSVELGIGDKVLFAEFQRGKNWRDAFAIADLFVMPSVSEPFGLTPLEAISYGAPVLVSKQSGISEVLANCLKVDFWDVNEMANQIVAVVQNDALRDELWRNAHREYEKMSWNEASNKVMQIYRAHHKATKVQI